MCGPTVMAYGSEEHKRHYLPQLAAGEEIWCQLFSEPAGGSDVAGLRTHAEKKGDDWIINGQKIWTSGAHYSDYGLLITRTDPNVPKHKGLTMFFLDMKSKGVEVRPIKQANGMQEFNEVYFTDVVIPDSQRLGAVGDGWNVSLTTLMNERMSIGSRLATGFPEMFDFCSGLMTDDGLAIDDRATRSKLAQLGGEGERVEIHQLPRDLGAVEGRAAGAGKLDRQAGGGFDAAGHRDLCDGPRRRGRRLHRRRRGRGARPVPADAPEVRPRCASPAAPTKSCAISSPSACWACPATSGSTRTCRSTRSRPRGGDARVPDAVQRTAPRCAASGARNASDEEVRHDIRFREAKARTDRHPRRLAGAALFLPRLPARSGVARGDRADTDRGAKDRVVVQQPAMATLDRLRHRRQEIPRCDLCRRQRRAPKSGDFPFPREYRGIYLARRRESGFQLYNSLGIPRGDQAGYAKQALENFNFFGAPHVAIVHTDEALGVYGAIDCGGYVTSFMLAAQALGVATIPQAALAFHSELVRRHFGIGDDRKVVCGISFGYPDRSHKANSYRTTRAGIADTVTFVEE